MPCGVPSTCASARVAFPGPLRRLRIPGARALCDLSTVAHPSGFASLRTMRLSGSVARASVCGVLGQEARVCTCASSDRLRRTSADLRPGMEGAGPARTCAGRGGSRRRGDPQAGRRSLHSRSGRPGASVEARRRSAACSGTGARRHLGSAVNRPPSAYTCASAPARPRTRRPASQCSPQRHSGWPVTSHRVPGGRCLHVWSDSGRMCCRAPPGGRTTRRGRHPRASSSLG
jgi:hypothetical protein